MASRVYDDVQTFLTECSRAGVAPTIQDIGKAIYKDDYDPDSRYQRDAVYKAIYEGRILALNAWDEFCRSPDFSKELEKIEYYEPSLAEAEFKGDDYANFNTYLYRGKFGEMTGELKKFSNEYSYIAALWRRKHKEISETKKMNLIVSSYGKNATWSIPSWWKWAVREINLFKRSFKMIKTQLERGESAKLLLPSGQPLSKAIGYVDSARALVEDESSWTCGCGMRNPQEANFCSNCGGKKPQPSTSTQRSKT